MGFMNHGVQSKHDARDFSHPFPGGQISQQTSPEHVIHGPVAAFVDRVALWVVRRGKNSLNSQCAGQFSPDFANKLPAMI